MIGGYTIMKAFEVLDKRQSSHQIFNHLDKVKYESFHILDLDV